MNSDFKELLQIFAEERVEYLIVGAYAVIHYTQPRYTKDIDIWIKPSDENAARVARAFARFGIPLIEVTEEDLAREGLQYVIGAPPSQVDFLTSLPGAPDFDRAWEDRSVDRSQGFELHFLGKEALIAAKAKAARTQDLADLDELKRIEGPAINE